MKKKLKLRSENVQAVNIKALKHSFTNNLHRISNMYKRLIVI